MLTHIELAAAAALAVVATNLDNLAVMLALMVSVGPSRASYRVVVAFVTAQAIVLGLSLAIALGAEQTMPDWTGYLGVIPLVLGLWGVWQQWRGSEGDAQDYLPSGGTFLACTLLFLSLSTDSLAVFAPLLADNLPGYHMSTLIGAAVAVFSLAAIGFGLSGVASKGHSIVHRLERLGPYAMIAVGLYVLANSGTDNTAGSNLIWTN